ncbi:MAG TPA: M23 family metallopeptidase [Telluria sp.]|nr:M23 family metallopeptidase [Telluria sp.]
MMPAEPLMRELALPPARRCGRRPLGAARSHGKTIIIAHANGFDSVYAHLDRRLVAEGDIVKAGQLFGLSGATGKFARPHLHFEVCRCSQAVNPETMLAGLDDNATPRALRNRLAPGAR